MAKKRGKNRRPSRGVKLGGGPISGILIAKFEEYRFPNLIILKVGVMALDGSLTVVPAKVQTTENDPPWITMTDPSGPVVANSAIYDVTGELNISMSRPFDPGAYGDLGMGPSAEILEQYPNMIFAGGAVRIIT